VIHTTLVSTEASRQLLGSIVQTHDKSESAM
jgi:hypothetical protein